MALDDEKHAGGHPGGQNTNLNTPYNQEERLAIIKLNLGKPYALLQELCKCSHSTISKDMKAWRASGGFEDFLQQEFFALHELVKKTNPEVPYKMVAQLMGKMLAKKVEINNRLDVSDQFSDLMRDTFGVERKE